MKIILTFLEGIASFLSPCTLPLLPAYISLIVGEDGNSNNFNTRFSRSVSYVLGFSVVFIALGVFSSTLGRIFVYYTDYFNLIFGVLMILIGLNYINIINIKFLNRTMSKQKIISGSSVKTAFLFGFFSSAVYTPCVGAFLGSALMMASTASTVVEGTLYLVSYSMGLGIPFIISSVFFDKLQNVFVSIRKHYKIVNLVSGVLLISIGIYNIVNSIGGVI